jgi:hypothetical protein
MATIHQIAANRRNAQRSTGPRTPRGKAIVSQNAIRHGLHSASPVIHRLEDPAHWERHRAATITSLAPGSPLEHTLAEHVAHILWRLGRVARYEHDATAVSQDDAPADLARRHSFVDILDGKSGPEQIQAAIVEGRLRHRAFTRFLQAQPDDPISSTYGHAVLRVVANQFRGFDLDAFPRPNTVPADTAWSDVNGWTADLLHRVIAAIAAHHGQSVEEALQHAEAAVRRWRNEARALARRFAHKVERLRQERALLSTPQLDTVMRFEAHLMRQLSKALAYFEALQHARLTGALPDTESPDPEPIRANPIADLSPPSQSNTVDHP